MLRELILGLTVLAVMTLQTAIALSAYTSDVALFQVLDVFAHANHFTDNLVPYNLRIHLAHVSPARRHGVQVGSANTAVLDFD